MTDIVDIDDKSCVGNEYHVENKSFTVDETYWGYIIHQTIAPNFAIIVAQSLCMFFGAAFLAASLGLWLLPVTMLGAEAAVIRVGASVLFLGIAVFLLWFASRGTQSELQVDNNLGEVREVIRNRAGKMTLIGRYGYDSIGGVFLDRAAGTNTVTLVLRYKNTAQTLQVAVGREEDLLTLRNRLGRDMMIRIPMGEECEALPEPKALLAS